MARPRSRKPTAPEQAPAWEERHKNDARGPLASNSSDVPDRTFGLLDGSAGEIAPVHGSGFQAASDAAHPVFPVQGADALEPGRADKIRRRAHRLWEEEGQPGGHHERHWLQAERELRGKTSGEDET